MEKFQMLFPFSSTATTSSSSSSSTRYSDHRHHLLTSSPTTINNNTSFNGQVMMRSPSDHHHHRDDKMFHDYVDQTGGSCDHREEQALTMEAVAADHIVDHDGGSSGKVKKVKKQPKYAFQTRSQVDILDDGYRWRKYGQKAVKKNKFPRSYYRCTYQGCNVKKQVQRLNKDEGVVTTTYEGIHTHPIEKPSENFEHILSQMQIYTPF